MEDKKFRIENYTEMLKQVCDNCQKAKKCKDFDKLCLRKRVCFEIAKRTYKQRVRKGEIDERS